MQIEASGIIFWTITGSVISIVTILVFIYQLLNIHLKKKWEFSQTIHQLNLEREKQILQSKIVAQEETMEHLSKEIHDNINQILSFAKLNLDLTIHNHNLFNYNLQATQDLINKAIFELNNISKGLSADALTNMGLLRCVEMEAERINILHFTKIEIRNIDNFIFESIELQLILYRIFQEAIKNAILHGKASIIDISFIQQGPKRQLIIEDNGCGFDLEEFQKVNHPYNHGLTNMNKRMKSIDGKFEIYSKISEGTKIIVSF